MRTGEIVAPDVNVCEREEDALNEARGALALAEPVDEEDRLAGADATDEKVGKPDCVDIAVAENDETPVPVIRALRTERVLTDGIALALAELLTDEHPDVVP